MREIKFRAWDNVDFKMLYPGEEYDIHFFLSDTGIIAERYYDEIVYSSNGDIDTDIGHEVLHHLKYMQYKGLKDKNGMEIYEGDVVKYYDSSIKSYVTSPVYWRAPMFVVDSGLLYFKSKQSDKVFDGKIIGNIYENPELLKKACGG